MKLKLVADENIPAVRHYLGSLCDISLVNGRALNRVALLDADALLVRSVTRVDEQLLAETGVGFVGSATSGTDHMDQLWLKQAGITFCHAPGSNANSVVEYVLAAVAATGKTLERLLVSGRVGIVGYGRVGAALAARLQALGINWCAYDPLLAEGEIPQPASLEQVLLCDLICLHPELTHDGPWPSYHVIGSAQCESLGSHQLLINASRGAVIDNHALLQRLGRSLPPAVVLVVWEHEPGFDPELLRQVHIGTAHIAGYSLPGKLMGTSMLCHAAARATGLVLAAASPEDTTGVLAAGDSLDGAALVRSLLRATYAIQDDDAALRAALEGARPQALGERFDRLRRDYPERGELKGRSVRCSFRQRPWIEALGCRPIMTGESG